MESKGTNLKKTNDDEDSKGKLSMTNWWGEEELVWQEDATKLRKKFRLEGEISQKVKSKEN